MFLKLCLMSTRMTSTKITILKRMMARIGARNRPKKTPMWLRKQLQSDEGEGRRREYKNHYDFHAVMIIILQ